MFESIFYTISAHPYLTLFVGMLIGGESFFLPAIFLALAGSLSLIFVLLVAIVSTFISDAFWYYIGCTVMLSKIRHWKIFEKKQVIFEKMESLFNQKGLLVVYLSKFFYGARTIAQILAGYHKIPFRKYMLVNMLGILSLFGLITIIGIIINKSFVAFEDVTYAVQIGFGLFVVVAVLIQVWIKKIIKKKFRL